MTGTGSHYWAGGEKIPLTPSDDVVVDLDSPALADLRTSSARALRRAGRSLTGSLVRLSKVQAEAALGRDRLAGPGVHPVFRAKDGSTIVVLPQVRVEDPDPDKLDAVARSVTDAHVTDRDEDRLVLEPESGRGAQALELANFVAEHHDVDMVQARFLRIVPRP